MIFVTLMDCRCVARLLALVFLTALTSLVQANSCLIPLDDEVNTSGPALRSVFLRPSQTENHNQLTPMNLGESLRDSFFDVDSQDLVGLREDVVLSCTGPSTSLWTFRDYRRLSGRNSSVGKRFHLLVTVSGYGPMKLSGQPNVGAKLFVNDQLVWSTAEDAGTWDGVGSPCFAPTDGGSFQVPLVLAPGEKIDLRMELLAGVVNYGGQDLQYGRYVGMMVDDVTIVDVEEDPRSRCDGCRFEGCGVAAIGSSIFEMNVGTANFESPRMGLVGRLQLDEAYLTNPTSEVRDALYYFDQIVGFASPVTRDPITDRIESISGANGLAYLTYTSDDVFQIDWYSQDQASMPPTGSPDRSFLFSRSTNGSVTTLDIDEVIGATTLSSQFHWDSSTGVRTLEYPGSLRRDVLTRSLNGGIREDVYETIDPLNGNLVVEKKIKRYQDLGWGELLISNQEDPDNGGELITYTYVTSAPVNGYRQLDSIASTFGPKVYFDYETNGLVYREYWGWKGQPANETWDQGRTREYSYVPIPVSPDNGTWKPNEPRLVREYIDGDLVRQSYLILDINNLERTEVMFMDEGSIFWDDWTSSRHPRIITRFEGGAGTFQGFPVARTENQLQTNWSYSLDQANKERTTTVRLNEFGPAMGSTTAIVNGEAGELVKETVTDKLSSLVMNETVYGNFDELHRPQLITYYDNTTEVIGYGCCGIDSLTDREGVATTYTYDDLKRRISQSRLGIETHWDFNAADNLLAVRRKGTDTSEVTLQAAAYGLDGRVQSSTNALLGLTTSSRAILPGGELQRTITHPNGGTLIDTYYLDGQLDSITGTSAFPESFNPTTESSTTGGRDYYAMVHRRTSLDYSGNATSEWAEVHSFQDGRLRYKRYADSTNPVEEEAQYSAGSSLPITMFGLDGVQARFTYDSLKRVKWSGIDVDQNALFTSNGPDRINETLYDVTTYTDGTSYDVIRTRQNVYPTVGNSTSVLVSESMVSTDGLRSWNILYPTPSTPSVTKTEISYSGNQRTETVTHASGSGSVRDFTDGRLMTAKTTDSNGVTLTQQTTAYDPHGRVASVTDLRTGTTDFTYNNADQVVSVTTPPDPDGVRHVTTTTYDISLRPTQVQQPDGTVVHTQYDLKGQVIKTFGSRTYPADYTYDSQGRRRTMTTWKSFDEGTGFGISGSAVTRWNYDPYRGWLISKDNPDESTGQAPVTEGTGGPVYTYTAAGRMATRTWQRGVTTTFAYDTATGDLDSVSYSDGTTTLDHTYNRQGQVTGVTQGGKVTSFTYDDVGNVTNESISGGPTSGMSFTQTLDSALRRSTDQLDLGVSNLAATSYAYSSLTGRLSSVSEGATVASYAYLANSDLIGSQTFGTGELISSRAYDNLNRLSSLSNTAAGEMLPLSFAYTYNLANQRTRTDEGDGKNWIYTYDALGQLTQGNHRLADNTVLGGQDFDYAFDEIGNRTSTAGRASAASTYTSNARNEYVTRSVPNVVDILGIDDPASTVTVEGQTATRSGESFHSEVAVSNGSNPVYPTIDITTTSNGGQTVNGEIYVPEDAEPFTYDDDGNLLTDGRWHYTWDAENRLTQMHTIAGVPLVAERRLEFEYDHQGRRISKKIFDQVSGGSQIGESRYAYDGWNLIAELDSAKNLKFRYLWGTDLSGSFQGAGGVGGLIAVVDHTASPAETHYVAYDGNGNMVALADPANGTWSARYEYGPFGEPIRTTGDPIAHTNPFRFSTKYTDLESGFLNYGHRLYNPTTGRWLSKDPIEEDGGLNLYGFVGNNGINHWDILGLDSDEDELDKRLAAGNAAAIYFYDEDTAAAYGAIDQRAIEQGLWVIDVSASIAAEFNLPAAIILGAGDLYSDPSWFHVLAMLPGVPRMPHKVKDQLGEVIERYGPPQAGGAAAEKFSSLIGRSPSRSDFIVSPGGTVFPVPKGAKGPIPADSGKGFQFVGGSGGHGLNPKAVDLRIMDPVTKGPYKYPSGYGSYGNSGGQTVNPLTGRTIPKSDPMWHIPAK